MVDGLTELRWRRRRLDRYEWLWIEKRLDDIRLQNDASLLVVMLGAIATAFKFNEADSLEKVEVLLSQQAPLYANIIRANWPLAAGEDPTTWGPKIAKGIAEMEPIPRCDGRDEFAAATDFGIIDEALERIERLDAMIDRTVKRLVQTKSMKQILERFEPKPVKPSVTNIRPEQKAHKEITPPQSYNRKIRSS